VCYYSGFISVEINFQKILILIALLAFISSWTYKLKVLNKYSFLPKTPQLTKTFKNQVAFRDLNPNLLLSSKQLFSDHDHFNNYLDEFLSAIRVFGFLEKPVFHELARHLQTRRLLAGDTLSLDEDKSFYIVVELSFFFFFLFFFFSISSSFEKQATMLQHHFSIKLIL
jgi:lysophospholipid hydrolase